MKISKIKISKAKLDTNFKLYLFLKELNGTQKLTDNEVDLFLENYFANQRLSHKKIQQIFLNILEQLSDIKKEKIGALLYQIKTDVDLNCFIFSLKLVQIKKLLLEEAKLTQLVELSSLDKIHQLSIEYDTISKSKPFYTRVNGALLSLVFFSKLEAKDTNFIAQATHEYIEGLFKEYNYLKESGLEANQMFMLMFTESINQSIVSDAGSHYEDRLYNILIALGIPADTIVKKHDETDSSMEYDFYFEIGKKKFGIGAKRTLRERYKQFIKSSHTGKVDALIEVTLGLDLSEAKAKNIRQHGVYLFIADEIYSARADLQQIKGIFPASALTLKTLHSLT